ncbi:hypothetical protein PV328_002102 [Microctonus aethiopoides]|uniref:Kielin/chordin-like protein n=1 Tax=Microctonus aethiopoides TaxID=144406 RepID=A0AA39FYQ0_9HYME|nr:hypothetical protein PV328_002102 [Microctonus aethiopoides]
MGRLNIIFGLFFLCLELLSIRADDSCDKSKCPGPIAYYESLGCLPIRKKPEDCCAYKYNCTEAKSRPLDKCYVNNHEYNFGEKLRDEDANPCDIGCRCSMSYTGVGAIFNCAIVDCFHGPVKPGCYRKKNPGRCCPGEEVCPENPEDRATCVVDGKIYKDGEHFNDPSDPNKNCVCQPGYEGKNVEPFCVTPKRPHCQPDFRNRDDIVNNCAPVYYLHQSPQTSCNVFSRCQNNNDTIITNPDKSSQVDNDTICQFGTLIMHYGDELNQGTDYRSVCVKCVCEVGPVPTCQRLPDNECAAANRQKNNRFSKKRKVNYKIKNSEFSFN